MPSSMDCCSSFSQPGISGEPRARLPFSRPAAQLDHQESDKTMAGYRRDFPGGFTDPAPAPLASFRHLRRFLYISIGIAVGMLLQARGSSPTPIASRAPLYVGLIAVEL